MTQPTTSNAPASSSADERTAHRYDARLADAIETKWQQWWDEHEVNRAPNPGEPGFDPEAPKFFCLDMFPYPSGAGLHVGHPEGYTATDIISRYKRLKGFQVLHPMGWDAFGLPAEQYAIQTGVHPKVTTQQAIDNFRRQLKRFGFCYDWSREVATIDEDYYTWTQWIWLQAYQSWFDHREQKAKPISDLVAMLESGTMRVTAKLTPVRSDEAKSDARDWSDLTHDEQRHVIDHQRLAYLSEQTVNWCPKLGTALANEEVINGRSERGDHPVYRKPLRQWMFRITAFAERLLNDLDQLDWPESTRAMQAEWIGRSEGAEIDFPIADSPLPELNHLRVYTTRPDTIFGATYMVVAPEHPLIRAVLSHPAAETDAAALEAYVEQARNRGDVERMAETKEKTGVFTGYYCVNPANNERIPIWTADYVLMGYGTGAIMAVPGGDQRDWDFATAFGLPIIPTVQPPNDFEGEAYTGEGPAINSGFLNGKHVAEAKRAIIEWLEEHGHGTAKVNYRLRDWLFSRQRYWGEPFPIVYDEQGHHHAVDPSSLPVVLPPMDDYHPVESDEPQPLLAKATDWVHTTAGEAGVSPDVLPPDAPVMRETNTMPGWAGSCWYYLRFCDPKNDDRFVSEAAEQYWMAPTEVRALHQTSSAGEAASRTTRTPGGVDLYVGGAEHSVLHLLYARFWHKILYDLGHVSTPEPFARLFHQGLITSFAYQSKDGRLIPVDQVEERGEGEFHLVDTGERVEQITAKMSKSLKNVINPDDVIHDYGADTFRLYEMYMGPLEAAKPWNTRDIVGVFRFLQRVWRLVVDEQTGALILRDEADDATERGLHRTIAKVADDIERLAFNTAIAAMIEFVNDATKQGGLTRDQLERFAIVLSPFAPHLAEELWSKLEREPSITTQHWPAVDESMLVEDQIELPVQILGKVRGRITVPADADQKAIEAVALADERIAQQLEGKTVRKVIVVPGKIVNIIAN